MTFAALIAANCWRGGKRWRWSLNARVAGRFLYCGPRAPAPSHMMANGARPRIQEKFDDVTLYNGDALAVLARLPNDSVDAVLTDPPYSSGGASLSAKQADPASKY